MVEEEQPHPKTLLENMVARVKLLRKFIEKSPKTLDGKFKVMRYDLSKLTNCHDDINIVLSSLGQVISSFIDFPLIE